MSQPGDLDFFFPRWRLSLRERERESAVTRSKPSQIVFLRIKGFFVAICEDAVAITLACFLVSG
jgi:hypothetical protein